MAYTDKELEEYFEKEELNFCTNKILNALKSLKFDIIIDKEKPISEDIYIEILTKVNSSIENWTR